MNDDEKAALDEIANSLQMINLLSTRLRRDLAESEQHAVDSKAPRHGPFVP